MKALGILMRLARRDVDEECQQLAALERRRTALQERIAQLGSEARQELQAAVRLPLGSMLLSAYLTARREQEQALRKELKALSEQRLIQLDRLATRRLEARRLEKLGERRRVAAGHEADRRAIRVLDDLVMVRAARSAR